MKIDEAVKRRGMYNHPHYNETLVVFSRSKWVQVNRSSQRPMYEPNRSNRNFARDRLTPIPWDPTIEAMLENPLQFPRQGEPLSSLGFQNSSTDRRLLLNSPTTRRHT